LRNQKNNKAISVWLKSTDEIRCKISETLNARSIRQANIGHPITSVLTVGVGETRSCAAGWKLLICNARFPVQNLPTDRKHFPRRSTTCDWWILDLTGTENNESCSCVFWWLVAWLCLAENMPTCATARASTFCFSIIPLARNPSN
jgi:hypothetical protein